MRLDDRLKAVANFVPHGARAADIGADHAYLAIALMTERGAKSVIVSEKNKGPLEAARKTIEAEGLSGKIGVRMGSGLAPFSPGEADTVCIAGMGGELIVSILSDAPDVLSKTNLLVLQPMNDAPHLRQWLYRNGWYIRDEDLADTRRVYEIIAARRGSVAEPDEPALIAGPVLIRKRPPLFSRHIEGILRRLRRKAAGMGKSAKARESEAYFTLNENIMKLEELTNGKVLNDYGRDGEACPQTARGGMG